MAFLGKSHALEPIVRDEIAPLAREWQALVEADSERLTRYATYKEENEWSRKADILGQVADTEDYGRVRRLDSPQRHNIPLPFGLALNIKHSDRIAGNLPDAFVDRRDESPQERYRSASMEKIVWAILRASGGKTFFKDAAWDGSQVGASCFDVYFDIDKQMPVIRAIDPAGVVVVRGLDDPHNFQRVYRAWTVPTATAIAEYSNSVFRGEPVVELLAKVASKTVKLVQVADKERIIRFIVPNEKGAEPVPVYEKVHNLGFVPYIVVPNIGPEREIWGWGDYELVRGLVHYIPTLFSREADIIRATAAGAYQEDGTGQSPNKIQEVIRKGGVLPVKRDSGVAPIEPPSVPDFMGDHGDRGWQFLKALGFAPDAAWGDGSAGSGSDRGLQLQPMMELTKHKQTNWSSGLSRIFCICFKMMEQKMAGPTTMYGSVQKGNKRTPFVFGPFGPDVKPQVADANGIPMTEQPSATADPALAIADEDFIELPRTPKELFAGDYEVRFEWQNRVDVDDPAFVASELNKFQQGVQSAQTTMERLGIQNPEDELRLIEQESTKYPWMRQGLIALLTAEIKATQQGEGGGGSTPDQQGSLLDSFEGMAGSDTAATDADYLGGGGQGSLSGGMGTPNGAA